MTELPIEFFGAYRAIFSSNIQGLPELTDVSGFFNLERVGVLAIVDNGKLTGLDGLQKLHMVTTRLSIYSNAELIDLDALADLTINSELHIHDNPKLTFTTFSVKTANSLSSLVVIGSPLVTTLSGLESLTQLNLLNISNMDGLESLEGLNGLTGLQYLLIHDNENLLNMDALSNLTESGNPVEFRNNGKLSDFCGLQSLLNSDEFGDNFFTENNAYNPTIADMQAGICRN